MPTIKTDIAQQLTKVTPEPISRASAIAVVDCLMEVMKQAILNGNRIEIRSFGVFETRPKKRGFGRDIRGGKTILIEEGTSVRFKPGKALRELPMKPSKKG